MAPKLFESSTVSTARKVARSDACSKHVLRDDWYVACASMAMP